MGFMDRFAKHDNNTPATPAATPATAPAAPSSGGGINLRKEKARIVLTKKNIDGVRAAVYLVLDYSGSMRPFYKDHTVQDFTERILALATNLDDNGAVDVCLFDRVARPIETVDVANYAGKIDDMVARAGSMSTTAYDQAMQAVIEHYTHSGATEPALVVFQTDGSPDSRTAAEKALCDAARLPIFWQFVGFGNDEFKFLHKLDDLAVPSKRVIDNAGFFAMGGNPKAMSDEQLYEQLLEEFPQWLKQAKVQSIVR